MMDLIEEMSILGLPTSFLSRSRSREKSSRLSVCRIVKQKESAEENLEATETEANPCLSVFFAVRSIKLYTPEEPVSLESLAGLEYDCEGIEAEISLEGIEAPYQDHDSTGDGIVTRDTGDVENGIEVIWERVWDQEYKHYYFYNTESGESTWDTPPGYEYFCSSPVKEIECSERPSVQFGAEEGTCKDSLFEISTMMEGECQSTESSPVFPPACGIHTRFSDESGDDDEDSVLLTIEDGINLEKIENLKSGIKTGDDLRESCFTSSEGKTVPRRCTNRNSQIFSEKSQTKQNNSSSEKVRLPGMKEMMSKSVIKYWFQRYNLFSKYDEGVKLDEEGWFSVTPEVIAEQQARRCPMGLVVDGFTGVGGNAIQFALTNSRVLAIDIDPTRIELARHNAKIYGVSHLITFIVGDFFLLAPFLKADLVFLSPPWGGPEYLKQGRYNIHTMLRPKDGLTLFKTAMAIAPNVVLFLPRNVDLLQLRELAYLTSPPLPCQVEKNYVNDKLKAVTAYFGADVAFPGKR